MSTPEGRIKAKVSRWLNSLGSDVWYFMPVQSGFGRPALDYECTIKGFAVAIETKAPGGEMTPTQQQTRDSKLAAGALVFLIWDDASLETCRSIINGIVRPDPNLCERGAYLLPAANRCYEEHLKTVLIGKAPKPAAGRDHGAPGAAPQRRAQPRPRGQDQVPTRSGLTET